MLREYQALPGSGGRSEGTLDRVEAVDGGWCGEAADGAKPADGDRYGGQQIVWRRWMAAGVKGQQIV